MKRKFSKILSLFLAVVMLMAVAAPLMSVSAADGYITIYVPGYGGGLYKNNVESEENRIWPPVVDIGDLLMDAAEPLLTKLANGMIIGDWEAYGQELYDRVTPIFAELQLDKNGEASDGSGRAEDMYTNYIDTYSDNYPDGCVTFYYDWRLSTEYNAKILEDYIDRVRREKNVEKVNLLGRCLGGNIVSAYLQNGKNTDKVNDVVMYIPSTLGIGFIGAIFSGQIEVDAKSVDYFANYFLENKNLIEDPTLKSLVSSLVSFLNEIKVLGLGTDVLQTIIDGVRDTAMPALVRDTFGSFPAMWAMVPDEYFDEAVEFCFSTDELKKEYAGLIEKITSYHDNVQVKAADTLKAFDEDENHRVMMFAKYNIPLFPLSRDSMRQGDGFAETERVAFGSTCADFGMTLTNSYIDNMTEEDKKYLSPDYKIDASSCLLRDTTWFIKDCYHDYFPDVIDGLINVFYNTPDMTVFTYDEYPQFLQFYDQTDREASGKIKPVEEGIDEDTNLSKKENRFKVFIRFFTSLFAFFAKLLKGDISLCKD